MTSIDNVRKFWNDRPCNIRHSKKDIGTKEYFDEVEKNFHDTLKTMTPETMRPDFWGGYSFTPYYFEFWKGHENRLNKRHVYERQDNEWVERLLQP